jgi:hypothetical protein
MKTANDPATVLLGYQIPSGEPVEIALDGHLCATGQTQKSGKTTMLEALLSRAPNPSLAFITKKNEGSFANCRRVAPFFRERADWKFVEALFEATLQEQVKWDRGWIMRVTRGARTLADVAANIQEAMKNARGKSADVYYKLNEYLNLVLPQLAKLPPSKFPALKPGISIMDLADFSIPVAALIIRSCIEVVGSTGATNTLVVIPESWKFISAKRSSPVKLAAEEFIRQAAASHSFLWLDSQDTASLSRDITRSVTIWIMGVQKDEHEVKRALSYITDSPKPKPSEVMSLKVGQFYVSWADTMSKVYVQPAWMKSDVAIKIARGEHPVPTDKPVGRMTKQPNLIELKDEGIPRPVAVLSRSATEVEWPIHLKEEDTNVDYKQMYEEAQAAIKVLQAQVRDLETYAPGKSHAPSGNEKPAHLAQPDRIALPPKPDGGGAQESVGQPNIPVIELSVDRPEIEVTVRRFTIKMSDDSLPGQLARLIWEGFFDNSKRLQDCYQEMRDRGWMAATGAPPPVGRELQRLIELGFIRRVGEKTYQIREGGVKVRVKEIEVEA